MSEGLDKLLSFLENHLGKPLMFNDLIEPLQINRGTLLKYVQALKSKGYIIDFDGSEGLMLKEKPSFLQPQNIQAYLKTNFIGQDLHYFSELSSGTEKAFNLAERYPNVEEPTTPLKKMSKNLTKGGDPFAGNGSVIVYEVANQEQALWPAQQSGLNLNSAVVLRPGILPSRGPQIALVACVALARTIEASTGIRPKLRWPNELVMEKSKGKEGRTVARISVTMQSNVEKINFIILGFAVNLNGLPEDLENNQSQNIASLRSVSGKIINRPQFAAALFRELEKWYVVYINKGCEKIIRELGQFFSYDKKPVQFKIGPDTYAGVIEGLDFDGSLMLRKPSGEIEHIAPGNIAYTPR